VGRYEIRGLLGSGGIGRVYAAHDSSLGREVAIKALAGALWDDTVTLRRFQREAKVLAALSHPNIASIYGFEDLDGEPYLVLEKVDGGTLAERIERGPLTVKEAIALAAQVTLGLAEAHSKGVIHRDLKPSNVMLSAVGQVKLVDFGLAKSTGSGPAGDVAEDVTVTAAVIGTAPYMSPEQIRGEDLDERTDVWAFGCLLYEMITGRQCFRRRAIAEVMAAVLRDEPDLGALPATTPAPLRWLIARCLRKDLATRPHHIGDIGLELVDIASELDEQVPTADYAPPAKRRLASRGAMARVVAAAAAVAAIATALLLRLPSRPAAPRPVALSLELPRGLALAGDLAAPFALAHDGSSLVVAAEEGSARQLYVRRLDDPRAIALAGSDGAAQPFLSPDDAWVGFFANRKLIKLPLGGGPAVELGDIGSNPRGAAWLADGSIVLAPSQTSGLVRVLAGGGAPVPLTTLSSEDERSHRWPSALPDGRTVLFTVGLEGSTYDEARLDVVDAATGERRTVIPGASYGRYAPDKNGGHLVFVRGGRIHALDFDLATLAARGAPEVVLEGVRYDPQNGAAHLALSANGDLLYAPGLATSTDSYLSWLLPDGRLERLSPTPRQFRDPRPSPDGSRVAVVAGGADAAHLLVLDVNGTATQLSIGSRSYRPTWSPDGRRVTVGAARGAGWQIVSLAEDGGGVERVLLERPRRVYPCDWTSDGRSLVFQESTPERGWDLELLSVDAAGAPLGPPQTLAATPFHEANAVVSPDGRWVAYESDELDGVFQIYARALPAGNGKVQISDEGARWPSWSADGRLAYWDTANHRIQVAQTRERDGELRVESRSQPFPAGAFRGPLARVAVSVTGGRFNAGPRDHRFLVLESTATASEPPLSAPLFISGWSGTLRRQELRK
jgi:serine/threonine-protein kinase